MQKQQIYTNIQEYFIDKPICKIQIFGSYARNEHKETSDIDILITLLYPVSLFVFFQYQKDLEKKLNISVDLGTPDSVSPYLWKYIEKDLETIYEK